MRIALVLVSLCLVLSLGALGLFFSLSPRSEPAGVASAETARVAAAPSAVHDGPQNPGDEVLARMDALSREVDELRAQVAALKAGAEREPATAAAAEAPLDESAATYAAVHRDAILKVIEDDRQAQQRKREEEQRARDLQAMLTRAERTAKRFGLTPEQQKSLADVYIQERTKMEDFRTQMREQGGMGGDPDQMRTAFQELRDWRLLELSTRLGPDLAQQINDSEFDRFRDAAGGGRRGNRGGNGGDDNGGGNGGNSGGGGF